MSRVHPINTWFSSCPRLDKSIGFFGFDAEKNIFFKTPIYLSACFLINNNNNNNNNNSNIFICTAQIDKVFKYALQWNIKIIYIFRKKIHTSKYNVKIAA